MLMVTQTSINKLLNPLEEAMPIIITAPTQPLTNRNQANHFHQVLPKLRSQSQQKSSKLKV